MTHGRSSLIVLALLVASVGTVAAQTPPDAPKPKPAKAAYFLDTKVFDAAILVPSPPRQDSETVKAELALLHQIEAARTEAQVAAAKADDAEEDIFIYRDVLGSGFSAEALPLTAALGAHVKNDEPFAGNSMKAAYQRPRPYQFDTTLHPVCKTTEEHNSYPSGHTIMGYLEGFTLAEMVPEKRLEILARADDYAHNRLVCGVHYPSDLAASRQVALAAFGYILATPRFQMELAAARQELRKQLGLP
jgi:acid phosphatase (class A)